MNLYFLFLELGPRNMKNIIYRIEFDLIELMESRNRKRRPYTGDRRPEMENRSLEHRPNIRYRRPEMVNRSSEWSPNIRDRAVEMENRRHFPQLVPQAKPVRLTLRVCTATRTVRSRGTHVALL